MRLGNNSKLDPTSLIKGIASGVESQRGLSGLRLDLLALMSLACGQEPGARDSSGAIGIEKQHDCGLYSTAVPPAACLQSIFAIHHRALQRMASVPRALQSGHARPRKTLHQYWWTAPSKKRIIILSQ
jgi:hypothetical protein